MRAKYAFVSVDAGTPGEGVTFLEFAELNSDMVAIPTKSVFVNPKPRFQPIQRADYDTPAVELNRWGKAVA
jgi:hypothetical protein